MPNIPDDRIRYFFAHLDKTSSERGCWLWTASRVGGGYGQLRVRGKYVPAHRFAYELLVGEIADGLFVCHRCDVRACCNPDHLFLGTQTDNMSDCVRKGRFNKPRGESHSAAKLTEAQAKEVYRLRREEGRTVKSLAVDFGVSASAINGIVYARNWPTIDKSDRPAARTGRGRPTVAGNQLETVCPECGATFSHFKSSPRIFCSMKCAALNRPKRHK